MAALATGSYLTRSNSTADTSPPSTTKVCNTMKPVPLNRKKLVFTEHSVPEVEGIASSIHGKVLHWLLFSIDKVVGVSVQITDSFRQYYPRHAEKFISVMNGIDVNSYNAKSRRDDIRHNFGFSQDHFVIGTIANFRKVKNHSCLIRACAILKDSHPQLRLIFVGTSFPGDHDNSEEAIRREISELGIQNMVVMPGYQSNIAELLSAFDAFCLPSFSEGLPVSVLEAMSAGVPVIGSQVRGIVELVKDRETGLLFNSDDDKDLSCKIEEIIKNSALRKEISANAHDYVTKNHDIQTWVQQYADIFGCTRQ